MSTEGLGQRDVSPCSSPRDTGEAALGIWGLRLITLFNFNADKTVTHRRYAGDKLGKVHWKIVAFTLVFAFCVSFIGN